MPLNYSIIIPTHNIPELLERLLATIPRRDDLEVIVVDDRSSEENFARAKEICRRHKGVSLYQTDQCGGGGKARNLGLRHARGKYLIFADSDDYFNLCFADTLEKYADTDYDLIYLAANSVDTVTYVNAERTWVYKGVLTNYLATREPLDIKYKLPAPWAKFIARRIVTDNHLRFDLTRIANDVTFSAHADYHAKNITADLMAIYCATDRDASTEKQTSPDKILTRMEVDAALVKFLHHNEGIPPAFINSLKYDYLSIFDTHDEANIARARQILTDAALDPTPLEPQPRRRPLISRIFHRIFHPHRPLS